MALTKAHNRMIEGAPVNVKDFGAVGDGVTDDSFKGFKRTQQSILFFRRKSVVKFVVKFVSFFFSL